MSFTPAENEQLTIGGVSYTVAPHPHAPGMPYGQEGRQAIVYQLLSPSGPKALKVFKPRYRLPSLVTLADRIRPFVSMSGLSVCDRTVLSPFQHADLLRRYPDLSYAVLMPWVEGPTWMEIVAEKRQIDSSRLLVLARELATLLARMEEMGIAHCDLSGPNVLLPPLASMPSGASGAAMALVDVEQMFGHDLGRPEALPGGSPGYAHRVASEGIWESKADRFAGAVLIAEMLGWSKERVRKSAWGESYFDPEEMQRDTDRYHLLMAALRKLWGEGAARLFDLAWHSDTLAECPTFAEWLVALPDVQEPKVDVRKLLLDAGQLEARGDLKAAAGVYEQVLRLVPSSDALHEEVKLILGRLQGSIGRMADVDRRGMEATHYEAAGRWQDAIRIYEGLLAEKGVNPSRRVAWQDGLNRCQEEASLASLFDEGAAAGDRGEWRKARELLGEVVRRRPGYERHGRKEVLLLEDAEKATRAAGSSRGTARPQWFWLVGAAALAALLLMAGAGVYQAQVDSGNQARATATAQAQETARAVAVQATGTAQAEAAVWSAATAVAASAATETAAAQATANEATAAEQRTATAQAQVAAEATKVAQATVAAQGTASALAAAKAAAQATADAHSAQARATGVAMAATAAVATAEAQATSSAPSTTGGLRVIIIWDEQPLQGYSISIEGSGQSAKTGPDGSVTFMNLPVGTVRLDIKPTSEASISNTIGQGGIPVQVTPGETSEKIFYLVRTDLHTICPKTPDDNLPTTPTFSWAPYPDATQYSLDVWRVLQEPNIRLVYSVKTSGTSYRSPVALSPGHYLLDLSAVNGRGHEIGVTNNPTTGMGSIDFNVVAQ